MLVAIHQPNFFPWLGYFDKIARADRFIIMDNAQFQKTGGNWCNRVKLLVGGEAKWITMPVVRDFHGVISIRDVQIHEDGRWRDNLLKTIRINYARAPFFDSIMGFLQPLVLQPLTLLAEYNTHAIVSIAGALGIDVQQKVIIGTALKSEGSATDLLISMIRKAGGSAYLCGGGADGYQQDDQFQREDMELKYQSFQHPIYPQVGGGDFVPGLSIIDALMNVGFEGVRAFLPPQPIPVPLLPAS